MYFQGTSRRQPVSQYRQTSKVFCHFQFSILFLVEYRSLVQTIGRILWSRVSINFQLIWKFCETVHEVFMTNLPKSGFSPVETLFLHNWLMLMIVSALSIIGPTVIAFSRSATHIICVQFSCPICVLKPNLLFNTCGLPKDHLYLRWSLWLNAISEFPLRRWFPTDGLMSTHLALRPVLLETFILLL